MHFPTLKNVWNYLANSDTEGLDKNFSPPLFASLTTNCIIMYADVIPKIKH